MTAFGNRIEHRFSPNAVPLIQQPPGSWPAIRPKGINENIFTFELNILLISLKHLQPILPSEIIVRFSTDKLPRRLLGHERLKIINLPGDPWRAPLNFLQYLLNRRIAWRGDID